MKKLLIVIALLTSPFSQAYESYYESSESLSRGGVDTGSWDYIHSTFNHPAELADYSSWDLFLKVNGQISDKTYDLILSPPEPKEGELENSLSQYFGNKYDLNANLSTGVRLGSLVLIPYFQKMRSNAQLNYKVYPEAIGNINEDKGYAIGYAFKIKRLSLGLSYLGFQRHYKIYHVDLVNSYNKQTESEAEESLSSINGSLRWDLDQTPDRISSIYLTFKNFNNPNQSSDYSMYNQDLIPLINFGFQKQFNSLLLDLEILDMNNYYASVIQNRIKLGASYKFSEYGFIRNLNVGLLDGSLSFGTSINLFKAITLAASTYEKNIYNFYEKKSRFYSISFGLDF